MNKTNTTSMLLACALLAGTAVQAQTPAKAPAGSTALCNDGSYASEAARTQACADRKGIKTWFGPAASAVQTQSPAVTATQVAPSTNGPSTTPATPANPERPANPAPRALAPAAK